MLNKLRHLIRSVRSGILWVKAVENASKYQYEASLSFLSRIYQIFGVEPPSKSVTPDINILYASVASKLHKYDVAVPAAKLALHQLDTSDPRYSTYDRDYLRYYCRVILEYCSGATGPETFRDALAVGVKFGSLEFEKVKSDLKMNFPITLPADSERVSGH